MESILSDIGKIPQLAIVPVENLILHEYQDEKRTPALIEKLLTTGVLRNPPIVIPLKKRLNCYMVLDGANRVSAFRQERIPHILVQIIQTEKHNLNSWNHVLWGISPDRFIKCIKEVPGIMLHSTTQALSPQELMEAHSLASIYLPDGSVFTAFTSSVTLIDRIIALNLLINQYSEIVKMDRTTINRINHLQSHYDDLCALVVLPRFQLTELMDLVKSGHLMPPGVTRFSVSPRILHINYELKALMSEESVEKKNTAMQKWISSKLTNKSVRFYTEPTIIFDE